MEKNGFTFEVRPDTLDEYVVRENAGSQYARLQLRPEDLLLDVGGNIGAFSVFNAGRVRHVVAYEPEPDNAELFRANVAANGITNVQLLQQAVVANGATEVSFFLNDKKNKGSHSMLTKRGRTEIRVPAVNFDTVLEVIRPDVVKVDIEGAEHDIVLASTRLHEVREIMFEYHLAALRDTDHSKYRAFISKLESVFAHVEYPEEPGKRWQVMVYARQ